MERIVRLRTKDRRYIKGASYPFTPAQKGISSNVYLTGQMVDPSMPTTKNGLTLKEVTGEVVVSEAKRKEFPYIINPFDIKALSNNQKFNVSLNDDGTAVNDEDYAIYKMLQLNNHLIAANENEYNPSKHVFYLEDVEALAIDNVSKRRKETKIMQYIFDLTQSRLKDLALLLNVYDNKFRENPDMVSATLLESKIIDHVTKNISVVGNVFDNNGGFTKEAIADLMVAKLVHIGQLRLNVNEFYYENQFIGNNVKEVQRWMKESKNIHALTKFNAILNKNGYNASLDTKPEAKLEETDDNLFKEEVQVFETGKSTSKAVKQDPVNEPTTITTKTK